MVSFQRQMKKKYLEHTSANPNGPLHIGHVRNSIFGDSLNRLLKVAGRKLKHSIM